MPALTRAINVPSRGIGEKSLEALISRAAKTKISPLEAIERIHDAVQPDIKPAVKHKVGSFVRTVRALRTLATEVNQNLVLLEHVLNPLYFCRALPRPTSSNGCCS
jgi:DNA helicase-2/ATP-dependent DNA helicase PcrA